MDKYYDELQNNLQIEGICFDNACEAHSKCLMTPIQARKTLDLMRERLNSNNIFLEYEHSKPNDYDYHYYIFWCDKLEEKFNDEQGYLKAKELAKKYYK